MRVVISAAALMGSVCCAPAVATEDAQFLRDPIEPAERRGGRGDEVWQLDQQIKRHPVAIQPYKRNYFALSYFDSDFGALATDISPFENGLDHTEINFQFSIRVPVAENILGSGADLYGAYSTKAFWQAFNADASSPFKDINHEPELFLLWPSRWQLGPVLSRAFSVGVNHQSNGQNNRAQTDEDGVVIYESLSRSWNRLIVGAYFEQKNFFWHLQSWYRIPEEEKEDPTQAKGDDNPDIEHYLGNFELTLQRVIGRYSTTATLRNNLDVDDNRGALQLDLSFPLTRKLNGMVQIFHGHGESLLDYNSRNTRIGFGLTLRGLGN